MSETKKDDQRDNKRDNDSLCMECDKEKTDMGCSECTRWICLKCGSFDKDGNFMCMGCLKGNKCEECDKEKSYMGCSECARWICRKCGSFDKDGDFMCMGCLKHGYYAPNTWCHCCEKASEWLDMHIIDGEQMCTDCLYD